MESLTYSEVASQLQVVNYLYISVLVLMVHDWLHLLDREVEHIWRKKWSVGKVLYLITRYAPLIDTPLLTVLHNAPYGAIGGDTCITLNKIATWVTFFGIFTSESILLLRTHAIYSGSKRVMIPLATAYVLGLTAGIVIVWRNVHITIFGNPPLALLRACYLVQKEKILFFDFLILLLLELAIVILTTWRGFREFKTGTPLLRILYRDSIAFFIVLFAFTLATILILALAPSQYNGLMALFTRVVHSIVCCRILLNLKQAAEWRGDMPDVPASGIVFAAGPGQQTNQIEMSRLEASGTRSDEEGHRLQAGEILLEDRHALAGEAESNGD